MSWNSRTNIIPIKWVNHNGWIDIFVIKKLLFLFVFLIYLPVFLLKIRLGELIGCEIWFFIQRVPTLHTFNGPLYRKNKKYLKKHDDDVILTFFQVFLFSWGSEVCQKYVVWVLVGCKIQFCIQQNLPIEFNSTSNKLSRSKIWVCSCFFLFFLQN